jgi:hypothetical protein
MPTGFYKQVVFNCHTNSALANYFCKERVFCETQDDIWSCAIKKIWFKWCIPCIECVMKCAFELENVTLQTLKLNWVYCCAHTEEFCSTLKPRLSVFAFIITFMP